MNAQFPVSLTGATAPTLLWAQETSIEAAALDQLRRVSRLPWVHGVAVCPAAVGVDIGCGMAAVKTDLVAADLPDDLSGMRSAIEAKVPVGRHGHDSPVNTARLHFGAGGGAERQLGPVLEAVHRPAPRRAPARHACPAADGVPGWRQPLHRGLPRRRGCRLDHAALRLPQHRQGAGRSAYGGGGEAADNTDLPDRDLAVFVAGTPEMDAYRRDLEWAQEYAARNRAVMLALVCAAVRESFRAVKYGSTSQSVATTTMWRSRRSTGSNCWSPAKGRSARAPATWADPRVHGHRLLRRARTRIGRVLLLRVARCGASDEPLQARKTFTAADLVEQTAGVESRKDFGVVDEIPAAYRDIDEVIAAQTDLVEVVAHLRQVVCVKGDPRLKCQSADVCDHMVVTNVGAKHFSTPVPRPRADAQVQTLQPIGDDGDGALGVLHLAAHHQSRRGVRQFAVLTHRPTEQTTFTMPVSSSRLMNVTPDAVAGRCRWVTAPATRTRSPSSTASSWSAGTTPEPPAAGARYCVG